MGFFIYIVMKLDMNEIYHQYIIRVVIFALFLYKRQIRQPNVYKMSVDSFVKKRLPWSINLYIDTSERLSKDEERELLLNDLLNNVSSNYLKTIYVIFTTPLKKDCALEVDLSDEEKYEKLLYL